MKNQKNRSMKVYSQNGRNYKAAPTIILKGSVAGRAVCAVCS